MLELDRVHVVYGRVTALHDVSIEIQRGEFVGVIGPNGAGKTTTLRTVAGLIPPVSGSVAFEGSSLVGRRPESIVRDGISLVPEGRRVFGSLTVEENLKIAMSMRRDARDARADLQRELERFPVLARYRRQSAAKLSGGEQQQLAIARALLTKPRLLILDEPSLGLAPQVVDLVFETLNELRDDGVTILLVEQNAARTVEAADRTYVLRSGHVAASGTKRELMSRENLGDLYLGVR